MSAKFPKGRKAPKTPIAPAATALPPDGAGMAPAKTLSGAFSAALGAKAQRAHSGSKTPLEKGADPRQLAGKAGARPIKNSKPGAPTVPRKGHR
ncbi:hypothetical protein [Chelativorans alearense]|uniref:hypothetical protein n=1 Tax=Chelativorans alearense TaxID=2681495 RepID=UPI0013D4A623|nr:hypothetical protein [Chelativorans alearense]